MDTEFVQEELNDIREHIELDCVPDDDYNWIKKGIIIEDDKAHKMSDFVKKHIGYYDLKNKRKVTEISIDESWDPLMGASTDDPDGDGRELWNRLVRVAHAANHGLLVINISNIKVFGHCWKLKQLAKQEAKRPLELWPGPKDKFEGSSTRFNFNGYVLIVLQGITFSAAAKYAAQENNLSEYNAMMAYYTRYSL